MSIQPTVGSTVTAITPDSYITNGTVIAIEHGDAGNVDRYSVFIEDGIIDVYLDEIEATTGAPA